LSIQNATEALRSGRHFQVAYRREGPEPATGYCQSLSARGGSPGYAWAVTGGALPTGVALDSYGHLTGTPTVAGTYTFTVTATDTGGQTATRSYTVTIA
jgi:large repetitive protein